MTRGAPPSTLPSAYEARRSARRAVLQAVPPALALIACLLAASPRCVRAQRSGPSERPTSSGVYSPEQAARGKEVYDAACVGCHTAASHSGAPFASACSGRLLSELYAFVSTRMPKSDPGSLTAEEYAQVLAYLLKLNGVPAGTRDLPADSVALGSIRIDMSSHTGRR